MVPDLAHAIRSGRPRCPRRQAAARSRTGGLDQATVDWLSVFPAQSPRIISSVDGQHCRSSEVMGAMANTHWREGEFHTVQEGAERLSAPVVTHNPRGLLKSG